MKTLFILILVLAVLGSCDGGAGLLEQKNKELQSRVDDLEKQLDDCQNGADKLLARMIVLYEKQALDSVRILFSSFEQRHPNSPQFIEAKQINDSVVRILDERKKEQEAKVEKERQEKLKALNSLKKQHDDISGITWYDQRYFTHYVNSNHVTISLGSRDTGKPWLRLMMSYEGEDWIFFEHAYLSYDGNTYEIVFDDYQNKKTDNSGGSVWEWITVSVDSDLEAFLRNFARSTNAKMRLSGKYSKTRTLPASERQGILDVLNGYDAILSGMK
jgi:hypothetical protein